MNTERESLWIVIPGWDKFQHRDAGRSGRGPIWIRDYVDQLAKDEYRALTYHQRGLLRDLRLAYAATRGQLAATTQPTRRHRAGSTEALSRRFGATVQVRDLEALVNAGFIVFSASKPPALSQQAAGLDVDVDVDVPPNPQMKRRSRALNTNGAGHICPHCGVTKQGPQSLADHIENVHYDLKPTPPKPTP